MPCDLNSNTNKIAYKEAHDWCLKKNATVFFHPGEALDNIGVPTIGKVQFFVASGGSAGDTLVDAIENWIDFQKRKNK